MPIPLPIPAPPPVFFPNPTPPSVANGYAVDYYLPGTGVSHTLTVATSRDCATLRNILLEYQSTEPTMVVSYCYVKPNPALTL